MRNYFFLAFHLLFANPRLFFYKVVREIRLRVFHPAAPTSKYVFGVLFEFDFQEDKNIKKMYFDLYEMGIIETMQKTHQGGGRGIGCRSEYWIY